MCMQEEQSFTIGVAIAVQEISTHPVQFVIGRKWTGSAFHQSPPTKLKAPETGGSLSCNTVFSVRFFVARRKRFAQRSPSPRKPRVQALHYPVRIACELFA